MPLQVDVISTLSSAGPVFLLHLKFHGFPTRVSHTLALLVRFTVKESAPSVLTSDDRF